MLQGVAAAVHAGAAQCGEIPRRPGRRCPRTRQLKPSPQDFDKALAQPTLILHGRRGDPHQRCRHRLDQGTQRAVAGGCAGRRDRPERGLPRRGASRPAECDDRRRPLPPGPACERDGHRRPAAGPHPTRPPGPQARPGMGPATPAAAWLRTAVGTAVRRRSRQRPRRRKVSAHVLRTVANVSTPPSHACAATDNPYGPAPITASSALRCMCAILRGGRSVRNGGYCAATPTGALIEVNTPGELYSQRAHEHPTDSAQQECLKRPQDP